MTTPASNDSIWAYRLRPQEVAVRPLFLRKRCLALIIHDRPASVGRLKYSKGARPDSSTNLVSRLFNRSVQGPKIRFLVFPDPRRLSSSPMIFGTVLTQTE